MLRVVAMADGVSGSDGIAAMDAVAGVACLLLLLVLVLPVALWFVQTTWFVRVLALGGAAFFLLGGWLAASGPEADLPPCHMMLPFALWSVAAFRHWMWPDFPPTPPGRCEKCGYDLTANVTGTCPECGLSVPRAPGEVPGRFEGLRRTGLSPAEEDEQAGRLLPARLAESRLHLWNPGDPNATGRRLLVGIMHRSLADLSLLDVLDQRMQAGTGAVDRVDVFDLGPLGPGDLERYVPGFSRADMSPVAALWTDGQLQRAADGPPAMQMIADLFGVWLEWEPRRWRWRVSKAE